MAPMMAVYGYMIVYRKPGEKEWKVDQCDEYANLPAHYLDEDVAMDRVRYLREKGVEARVSALLAEASDSPEEFDKHRIEP